MKEAQIELGEKMRAVLEDHGYKSVAADGYKSPELSSHIQMTLQSNLGQNSPKPECRLLAVCHLSVETRGILHISYRSLWVRQIKNIQRTVEIFSTTLSTVQE
ncbi:MAG: hypothetical protein Ct9H90mP5_11570 [Acidimicrobiaceae bacterium]|nr:MAG: hypothetical protein Ct9H90mP5_11570 [Acidimicrobiaceae bacterium]